MKTTSLVLGGLAVVVVVILVLTVGRPDNVPQTIKIGVTNSLTGKYAMRGEQTMRGMQLAVDALNSTGGINGKKIELLSEDNQGDPKVAVSGVNKLLDTDHVDFVLSAFTSITNAVKSSVAQHGKVMIYASTVSDIAKSNPLFYMDYYKAEDHGKALADVVAQRGYRSVKAISEVAENCTKFNEAFDAEATSKGVRVLSRETYLTTDKDVKTQLLKLKSGEKFDALVLCSWQHEQIIMPEMEQLGMLGVPTFHWLAPYLPVAQTKEILALFSKNNATTVWYGFSGNGSPEEKKFVAAYRARYSEDPTPDAAYSYDDVQLLANAAKQCPSLLSTCIEGELTKANYAGAGGHVQFDTDRVMQRSMVLLQAKDGAWRPLAN